MRLDNIDLEKLQGIVKAAAIEVLGGESGNDYSSWIEDIVQDTMVSILEYEETVQDVYNLGSVIAFRKAVSFKTKEERRREIELEYGDKINSTLTGQSSELLAADPYEILACDEMRDRLDALSPLLYSTVERHYIDGRSIAEIALADGVTEGVIYTRLSRAREYIRDEQEDEVRTVEPSKDGVEEQQDRFAVRLKAHGCRQERLLYPDGTMAEWREMYG